MGYFVMEHCGNVGDANGQEVFFLIILSKNFSRKLTYNTSGVPKSIWQLSLTALSPISNSYIRLFDKLFNSKKVAPFSNDIRESIYD